MSDFFLNLGWGFLSPVFAIFVLERITHGSALGAAEVAGLAALFYWIPKSLFEIPIGIYLDKHPGEKDDFWFMFIGISAIAIVPLGYIFAYEPWHIYLLQVIYAAGMAMAVPSWLAIFTRHVDKGQEAFEWGMETSFIGFGAGVGGGLSGILVALIGFKLLFIFVSGFTIFAAFLYLLIRNHVSSRDGHHMIFSGEKPVVEP